MKEGGAGTRCPEGVEHTWMSVSGSLSVEQDGKASKLVRVVVTDVGFEPIPLSPNAAVGTFSVSGWAEAPPR